MSDRNYHTGQPKDPHEGAIVNSLIEEMLRRRTLDNWLNELKVVAFINRCERQYGSSVAQRLRNTEEYQRLHAELLTT